jgi:methionyl-tRNA formyltransferase
VKVAAGERGLQVLTPESAANDDFLRTLRGERPELGVVVAYGQILIRELLELPSLGFVNVHYSLLPELRGAAPVYGALRQGLDRTGITIQFMAEELDAGDIILQRAIAVEHEDNRETLTNRLTEIGVDLLLKAVELILAGNAPRLQQDHSRASYVGRVRAEDCRIDWSADAGDLRNLVRACTPWPGAWCMLHDTRVKVQDVGVVQKVLTQEGRPGEIVEIPNAGGPMVLAGEHAVEIRRLQPAGRQPMSGEEFLRGARLEVGDCFQ